MWDGIQDWSKPCLNISEIPGVVEVFFSSFIFWGKIEEVQGRLVKAGQDIASDRQSPHGSTGGQQ